MGVAVHLVLEEGSFLADVIRGYKRTQNNKCVSDCRIQVGVFDISSGQHYLIHFEGGVLCARK
jgi:hypothetical protein